MQFRQSIKWKVQQWNPGLNALLFCLLVAFLQLKAGAAFAEKLDEKLGLKPLPVEEMRAVTYTKAFAKRFGLPGPEPGNEPSGGIEAMEFVVEIGRPWTPFYYCNLKIYLDSSLPVTYPEGSGAGNKYLLNRGIHFFGNPNERFMGWSKSDRVYFNDRLGRYNGKAFLASEDYVPREKGFMTGLQFVEYHSDVIPGLAYIKLDIPTMIEDESLCWPLEIWLIRAGDGDHHGVLRFDRNDLLKFKLPRTFYKQIYILVKKVSERNHLFHEHESRERIN